MSLDDLFCAVEDFCRLFLPDWHRQQLRHGERKRLRGCRMTLSASMTILIHFHQSHYRDCKAYYWLHVCRHLAGAFPKRLSYNRFVALIPTVLVPLGVYLQTRKGQMTGIAFIDATSLVVCPNRRLYRQKVFKKIARRGKTAVGWCYGFKRHRVVNDRGELLAFQVTPGNVADRKPVPRLATGLAGKLCGDRGYISQKLFEALLDQDLQLITTRRPGMQNPLLPLVDKLLLRKRALIDTINDQLKNSSQIEPTRHRSIINWRVNLLAGLVAYTQQPQKPSLNLSQNQLKLLNYVA
jgi:hypothetical protein